jgi:hypothetical protein
MERNSTIAAWSLPGGISSAADKGVSAMILSYHDSVPPTFADKQVNAHGRVPHPARFETAIMRIAVPAWHVVPISAL